MREARLCASLSRAFSDTLSKRRFRLAAARAAVATQPPASVSVACPRLAPAALSALLNLAASEGTRSSKRVQTL